MGDLVVSVPRHEAEHLIMGVLVELVGTSDLRILANIELVNRNWLISKRIKFWSPELGLRGSHHLTVNALEVACSRDYRTQYDEVAVLVRTEIEVTIAVSDTFTSIGTKLGIGSVSG